MNPTTTRTIKPRASQPTDLDLPPVSFGGAQRLVTRLTDLSLLLDPFGRVFEGELLQQFVGMVSGVLRVPGVNLLPVVGAFSGKVLDAATLDFLVRYIAVNSAAILTGKACAPMASSSPTGWTPLRCKHVAVDGAKASVEFVFEVVWGPCLDRLATKSTSLLSPTVVYMLRNMGVTSFREPYANATELAGLYTYGEVVDRQEGPCVHRVKTSDYMKQLNRTALRERRQALLAKLVKGAKTHTPVQPHSSQITVKAG